MAAQDTEEYVRPVIERSLPRPISLKDIEEATHEDECLQLAIEAVLSGDWRELCNHLGHRSGEAKESLAKLSSVKDELAVSMEGCLLRGPRLVILEALRQ